MNGKEKFLKLISLVLVISIFTLAYLISQNHYLRFDLSKERLFTLSDETKKVLSHLKCKVKIIGFFKTNEKDKFLELADEYRYLSKKVSFKNFDPDKHPMVAKSYGIKRYGTVVVEACGKRIFINKLSEEEITNGILKAQRVEKKVVYFLKGHGERSISDVTNSGYSKIKDEMLNEGISVKTLSLLGTNKVPSDCSLLVIASPKKPILKAEKDSIIKYMRRGSLFIMVDPYKNFDMKELFKELGVKVEGDLVVDPVSKLFGGGNVTPVVTDYPNSEITKDFSLATLFPIACGIYPIKEYAKPFLLTSKYSWGERDINKKKAKFDEGRDKKGPIPIGVFGTYKKGRFVIIGDSDFSSNAYVDLVGNRDLFLNAINWLISEEHLIAIRPKKKSVVFHMGKEEGRWIVFISFASPFVFLLASLFVFLRRRKL